jgi:hypothetical protein
VIPVAINPSKPRHWWFLSAFYLLAVAWGMRDAQQGRASIVDLLLPLALAFTLAWWTICDAAVRGCPIPAFSQAWLVLFAVFAVPIYVVRSRGWRGVGLVILHVLGWYTVGITARVVALLCFHELH